MATYQRETRIRAPLEDVWDFHSRISGLEVLTPDWMGLQIESVIGPDGEQEPEILEAGTEIDMSLHPFGVGPRQHWTSVITEREFETTHAYFRDELVRGPFDYWLHTHSFFADGAETLLRDHVAYELPLGGLGGTLDPFSIVGFDGMFRDRHNRTKQALESERVSIALE